MQNPFFDFLGAALIPILSSDVAAGSARDVHGRLIFVAAVRALPDELVVAVGYDFYFSRVAAFLAAVGLCVELGVHDVLIDVFEERHDGGNIVLHVRNLYIADGSAGRKLLELALEREFCESVNLLSDMNMIAVRDVVFVRHALNLTEALFEAFCEFVCG